MGSGPGVCVTLVPSARSVLFVPPPSRVVVFVRPFNKPKTLFSCPSRRISRENPVRLTHRCRDPPRYTCPCSFPCGSGTGCRCLGRCLFGGGRSCRKRNECGWLSASVSAVSKPLFRVVGGGDRSRPADAGRKLLFGRIERNCGCLVVRRNDFHDADCRAIDCRSATCVRNGTFDDAREKATAIVAERTNCRVREGVRRGAMLALSVETVVFAAICRGHLVDAGTCPC